MPTMHSPAMQCCLCVVGVFMFLMGLIMFSIGICLILNYGVWDNEFQITDFDTEEGKRKVGIVMTCVGVFGMCFSVFVSLFYLCRDQKTLPKTIVDNQSKSSSTQNASSQCVRSIKEKPPSQLFPAGPYSRAFKKPHKKIHQKRKIRQTPRLDRIQEAASRKASEIDLPMAAYDEDEDEDDKPDSPTNQRTETKTDTTDSELTSEARNDFTNTSSFPPIRIPVITKTTPNVSETHTDNHYPMSEVSITNKDYDVFDAKQPSVHALRTTNLGSTMPVCDDYNSSFSSNSTIVNPHTHLIGGGKKLPDVETIFHKRHISHQPLVMTQNTNTERVPLKDVENDTKFEATCISENSNSASEIHSMYPHSVKPEDNKVKNWVDSCAEPTFSFQECDRLSSDNDEEITSVNSKGTHEERKEWYLETVNTVVCRHSDDNIHHTDKNYLLGDETLHKELGENVYSQEYIPTD